MADIHSNLAAFQSVLGDVAVRGGVAEIWCLGDVVGYGPDPGQCIELLGQYEHVCVAGNHDWAAINKLDTAYFNPPAAAACHWTAQQLTDEDRDYLAHLPLTIKKGDFTLVHGSPREPIWEYLLSVGEAEENRARFKTKFCLVGHSHVPLVFKYSEGSRCSLSPLSDGEEVVLGEARLIINPGGVGQPRDGDPRASYAIYDEETRMVTLHRVAYDIKATQKKMIKQGLPMPLVTRLSYGM
ncbi:MAG: metallophosphoesterase family protein [Dehalococcoidia bacterium]|nr:MAG: metallophosphoesterase family protein [Dehalococcoidia bacterium]